MDINQRVRVIENGLEGRIARKGPKLVLVEFPYDGEYHRKVFGTWELEPISE